MAGRIPPSFIDQLLLQVDIAELIGKYIPLKQRGREFLACCPFHNEKTPSFKINSEKQIYHCFGCGAGGNAISFLMEHQHLSFVEAVEALALDRGVDIPREAGTVPNVDREKHRSLLNAMERTAEFYYECLKREKRVQQYLKDRGVDGKTAKDFMLGVAPQSGQHLKDHFAQDYDEKALLDSGLLKRSSSQGATSSQGGQVYAAFRNRLMFPLRNRRGQIIAFGGRVLPGDESPAKYINSPETPLFQKRHELYGVYELRQADKYDHIIVVEGYMDVVALAQQGVRNVVATLGTAVTRNHIQKLLRLVPHIIFCMDGDNAGRKAAISAMEQSLPVFVDGHKIDFMFLPSDHDPDSFIREHGKDRFLQEAKDAKPIADLMFEYYVQGLDLNDPADTAVFNKKVAPLLAQIPAGIFREKMYARLAKAIGVGVDEIKHDYQETRPQYGSRIAARPPAALNKAKAHRYNCVEVAIILLLEDPKLAQLDVDIQDIVKLKESNAQLLTDIFATIKTHGLTTGGSVIEHYRDTEQQEQLQQFLSRKSVSENNEVRESEFRGALERLKYQLLEQEINELSALPGLDAAQQERLLALLTSLNAAKSTQGSSL